MMCNGQPESQQKSVYNRTEQITTTTTTTTTTRAAANVGAPPSLPPEVVQLSQLEMTRINVSEHMPENLSFLEMGKKLKEKNYRDEGSYTHWIHFSSKEMRAILDELDEFQKCLKASVTLDNIAGGRENLEKSFLRICRNCTLYINSKQPGTPEGQIRKKLVEQLLEQANSESQLLRSKAEIYEKHLRERASLPGQTGSEPPVTWMNLLAVIRTEYYTDGQNGVHIEKGGAGTSDLYIIEKDGEKLYFKEDEKRASDDDAVASQKYWEMLSGELKLLQGGGGRKYETLLPLDKFALIQEYQIRTEVAKALATFLKTVGDIMGPVQNLVKVKQSNAANLSKRLGDLLASLGHPEQLETLFREYSAQGPGAVLLPGNKTALSIMEETIVSLWKSMNMASHASQAKIEEGDGIAKRNVATARLAKLLKIDDLIMDSRMAEVTVNGVTLKGVAMKKAEGETLGKVRDNPENAGKTLRYSPKALRQLSILQIFDVLCGQTDRNEGNYLGVIDDRQREGEIVVDRITGIDNDLSFGCLKYDQLPGSSRRGIGCMIPLRSYDIVKKEWFTTPLAVDDAFAATLEQLTPDAMVFQLGDLLSLEEQAALRDRLEGIQGFIRYFREKTPELFLSADQDWSRFRDLLEGMDEGEASLASNRGYLFPSFLKRKAGAK